MKKVTYLLLFLAISLFFLNNIYASQILLHGYIFDSQSKKPIGVSIEFKDADGKKIKTQSNSLTGEFQQILESNTKYSVVLNSEDILRREVKIQTIDTNQYAEQKIEFNVFKPTVGNKIFAGNIFQLNSTKISIDGEQQLEELQLLLRFNRNLNVEFKISGDNDLVKLRKDIVSNWIENWKREKSRIKILEGNEKENDFVVKISDIKSYLD